MFHIHFFRKVFFPEGCRAIYTRTCINLGEFAKLCVHFVLNIINHKNTSVLRAQITRSTEMVVNLPRNWWIQLRKKSINVEVMWINFSIWCAPHTSWPQPATEEERNEKEEKSPFYYYLIPAHMAFAVDHSFPRYDKLTCRLQVNVYCVNQFQINAG